MTTILIKNGTIVNADKQFRGDILVQDGKIKTIKPNLNPDDYNNVEVVNAAGMLLFPGGIDPHVHMHLPTPAGFSSDDFYTGSKAAIMGGTTTLIDFVTPQKGQKLCDALSQRTNEATNCLTDYSFHVSPVEWRSSIPSEIKHCIEEQGVTSFKVYMAYKDSIGLEDEDLRLVMNAVAEAGGMVTIHCEDGDEIEMLRNKFYQEEKRSPHYHPLSRPPQAEAKAVEKAISIAAETKCPLYIVHVSSALSLEHIRRAQQRGQKVFAETCPHYLLLDDSRYEGTFNRTAPYVLSPPLRKKEDNEALWKALSEKTVSTVGTDHCPFTMKQKQLGKDDFRKIANGAGGVEHRMKLLYTYGVRQNRISLNRFVAVTSTNAAKIFGLYPQKGIITEKSDADIVVWNPLYEGVISTHSHIMNCDNDIFEGFDVTGRAEYVIAHGEIVVNKSIWNGNKKRGSFLFRNLHGKHV